MCKSPGLWWLQLFQQRFSAHKLALGLGLGLYPGDAGSSSKQWKQTPASVKPRGHREHLVYFLVCQLVGLGRSGGWWTHGVPKTPNALLSAFTSIRMKQRITLSTRRGGVGQVYVCWEQVPLKRPLLWQLGLRWFNHVTLAAGTGSLPPPNPSHIFRSLYFTLADHKRSSRARASCCLCPCSFDSSLTCLKCCKQWQTNILFECWHF